MKSAILIVLTTILMGNEANNLQWIIEPNYQEIVVYGQNSFVARQDKVYKVYDYNENVLHEFTDREILGVSDHSNEGGELQEVINVNYRGNKSRLFNIASLKYLHEEKYYLLQTDYYDPERRLIRVFDEKLEGLMDYDGIILLYPKYQSVVEEEKLRIGFGKNEISIFNKENRLINTLPYQNEGSRYIKKRKLFKVQKHFSGETNIYQEVRSYKDGYTYIDYEKSEALKLLSGVVDLSNQVIIPFEYSSIQVKSENYLEVTKDEKITNNGFPISFYKPKRGVINFENEIILPIEYKYISTIEGASNLVQVENFEEKRAIYNLLDRKFETEFIYSSYNEAEQKLSELDTTKELLPFEKNGLRGIKNKQDEIVIPAKYRIISPTLNPDIYVVHGVNDEVYGDQGYYHIGLKKEIVPTVHGDRGGIGGYKRNNQKNVISVMHPETGNIGFYKTDGTLISKTKFDDSVEGFSEDLAPVCEDDPFKVGMIDLNGNQVYDYIFESMTLPYDGKSIVKYKGKFGILKLR